MGKQVAVLVLLVHPSHQGQEAHRQALGCHARLPEGHLQALTPTPPGLPWHQAWKAG